VNQDTSGIPQVGENGEPINPKPLPEIVDAAEFAYAELDDPPALIHGLVHIGSKLVVGGSSKAKKTWTLLHIAVSVATGSEWLGHKTEQARVLYINLEIQPAFFAKRLRKVLEKLNLRLEKGCLDVLNLRGYAADATFLIAEILEKIKGKGYALVIFDPIYKCLGNRDENSAGDMTDLLNTLERLAVESGAAVAFGAHFSKGNQAKKESIDRISGSGVFARDPDTILTLTSHEAPDAYVVEATLRNFAPLKPFCIRWEYPVMTLAPELRPEHLKKPGKVGKAPPLDGEFLDFFPKHWAKDDPRAGLLSNAELTQCFKDGWFDKDALVACRDRAEKSGQIVVIRHLPRNQVLAGRPEAAEAFLQQLAQGKPAAKRKPQRRDRTADTTVTTSQHPATATQTTQFSSPPGEAENCPNQCSVVSSSLPL
jgi:hypothetical protein